MDFTHCSINFGASSSSEQPTVKGRIGSQTSIIHEFISPTPHHHNTDLSEDSIHYQSDTAVFIPDLEEDDIMEITESLDGHPQLGIAEDEVQDRPRHGYGQSFDFDLGERQTEVANSHRMNRPRSLMGFNVTIAAVNHMRGLSTESDFGDHSKLEFRDIDRNGNPPTIHPNWVGLGSNHRDSSRRHDVMSFIDDMNKLPNPPGNQLQLSDRRASEVGQTLDQEREQHRSLQESKLQWHCTRSAAGIAQHFSTLDIKLPLVRDGVDGERIDACRTNLERANLWIKWRDQHHPLTAKRKVDESSADNGISSETMDESRFPDDAAPALKKVKTGASSTTPGASDAVTAYWETITPPATRAMARAAHAANTADIDVATGMHVDGSNARNPDGTGRVPLRKYQNRELSLEMHTSSSFTIKSKYGIPLSLQLLKDWNFYRPEMEKWKHPQIIDFWQEKGRWLDDKIEETQDMASDNVISKGIRDQIVEDLVDSDFSDDSDAN